MEQWGGTIIYILIFIAIFYFLLIRPQSKQKKQRDDMMSNLSVNDRIYTTGGILGTITMIKEDSVWIRVADKVEIQVLKGSIAGVVGDEGSHE
jgi:preprotein translocase subunit YajC